LIQYNGPIFLHPPKTAGSSIVNALVQSKIAVVNDDVDFDTFMRDAKEMHKTFEEFGYCANSDYSISVRSPYTRYVSIYYQFYWNDNSVHLDSSKDSIKSVTRFKRYLMNALYRSNWSNAPCTHWTNNITGNINIIKFENLVTDVNRVYNIDLESFPHKKRQGFGIAATGNEQESVCAILKYYDDSVISIINEIAQSDFTAFGYTKFNNYQEMIDYAQT
jgi:hypothetical protein